MTISEDSPAVFAPIAGEQEVRVLIIAPPGDMEGLTETLNRLLPGAETVTAPNCIEGWKAACHHVPEVILSDLELSPGENIEMCRQLREDSRTSHVPIIMMTGENTPAGRRFEMLDIGVDLFLSKPVDEAGLAAQVNAMLRLKKAEDSLKRNISENDAKHDPKKEKLLLRDVHHRIKNNLTIVSSLLNLQGGYVEDPPAREALNDSRRRIQAIALLHEKLYNSDDLVKINVGRYVRDLAGALITSLSFPEDRVELSVDIPDIFFHADISIPLGLIITELVTNALKYGRRDGEILGVTIRLLPKKDMFRLTVKDTGPGMPENLNWRNAGTLGFQLVTMLVEQLGGAIRLDRRSGTAFHISFPAAG